MLLQMFDHIVHCLDSGLYWKNLKSLSLKDHWFNNSITSWSVTKYKVASFRYDEARIDSFHVMNQIQ